MIKMKVEIREGKNTNETLRKMGFIPAVFYGPKQKSTPIKIEKAKFMKIYEGAGESTIINLNDGKDEHDVLIHDVQFHAVSGEPIHVDFYVIEKGKKVEIDVPIEFFGEAPAEKKLGGILVKSMHELSISAMPKDLPQKISVDISSLENFDSQIKVTDIKLPEGVNLNEEDLNAVVILVKEPKEEVVEETPVAFDPNAIEVEAKGKKPEEGVEEGGSSEKPADKKSESK